MADDQRYERRNPRLVFLDGTMAILYRVESLTNTDEVMCSMVLFEWAKRANNITDEDIEHNEPNPQIAVRGMFKRKYKKHYMVIVSENPEFPLRLMMCNFEGNLINIADTNFGIIQNYMRNIDALNEYIKSLEVKLQELSQKLQDMAIGRISEKRQQDRIYGFSKEEFMNSPFFQTARLQEGKDVDK